MTHALGQKRFHIVIGAVVFAILTWVSVNMRDEYTVTRHLPVVLENTKEGRALKFPVPRFVSVRFRGSGWAITGLYLSPDVKYYIDVASLGAEDFVITGRDLLEHIILPVTLQILEVKPDTLRLAIDEYVEKRVPIIPHIYVNYHDGYGQVGPMQIDPESAVVGGSEYMVRRTASWPTVYKKFDNLRTPVDMDIPLEESPNYSVEAFNRSTHLKIGVQPFAEKTITGIPVTAVGVPSNREVIFIPPRLDIIVRGGIDQLAKLTVEDFSTVVNYQLLISDSMDVVIPQLEAPREVRVVSKKPDKVQFIIRKKL